MPRLPARGAGSTGSPVPSPSPPGLIRTGGPELGKAASQQHYTPGRKCCLCEEFGLLKRACCSLPQRCAPRASTCSLPACLSLLSLGVSKVGATAAHTDTTFRAKWDGEAAGKCAGSPGGDLPRPHRVEEAEPELRLQGWRGTGPVLPSFVGLNPASIHLPAPHLHQTASESHTDGCCRAHAVLCWKFSGQSGGKQAETPTETWLGAQVSTQLCTSSTTQHQTHKINPYHKPKSRSLRRSASQRAALLGERSTSVHVHSLLLGLLRQLQQPQTSPSAAASAARCGPVPCRHSRRLHLTATITVIFQNLPRTKCLS